MFVQSLEKISQKIATSKDKAKGYKLLENKILNSPALKTQFEIYTTLKEKANKVFDNREFNKLATELKEKANKFSSATVKAEIKSLLEYFNVNPVTVKNTVMDSAINLNEKALRRVVFNDKKIVLAETYKNIIRKENEDDLRKQFQIVNFLSEAMGDKKRKTFIKESLKSLLAERYTDYNSCAKKLYKLRTLTESILNKNIIVEGKKSLKEDEEDGIDSEKIAQYGGGKKALLASKTFLKNIEVSVPEMYKKPEKIIIDFKIDIYPVGATAGAAQTSNIKARMAVQKLERLFVNATIYQSNRTNYFDPVGTIWEVGRIHTQPKVGKKYDVTVTVYLNTNTENETVNTWEDYKKVVSEMLTEFNALLPDFMKLSKNVLTPEAQKQSLKNAEGLSKLDKEQQSNEYGLINRDLIKKVKGGQEEDEAESRIDDFSGAF